MTPFRLDVLMHYFVRAGDHEAMDTAPIWAETVCWMMFEGLLRERTQYESRRDEKYVITPRGEAHCRSLLEVPLPVQIWVTPKKPDLRCLND